MHLYFKCFCKIGPLPLVLMTHNVRCRVDRWRPFISFILTVEFINNLQPVALVRLYMLHVYAPDQINCNNNNIFKIFYIFSSVPFILHQMVWLKEWSVSAKMTWNNDMTSTKCSVQAFILRLLMIQSYSALRGGTTALTTLSRNLLLPKHQSLGADATMPVQIALHSSSLTSEASVQTRSETHK